MLNNVNLHYTQPLTRAAFVGARGYATAEPDLKATLREAIPAKRELLKKPALRIQRLQGAD